MNMQEITYRVTKLRANFDPTNPEHLAELKAIQAILQPILDSLAVWMAGKTIEYTVKANTFSDN